MGGFGIDLRESLDEGIEGEQTIGNRLVVTLKCESHGAHQADQQRQ